MTEQHSGVRLAVDIGGTFTDIALELDGICHSHKLLTTQGAPEQGVLRGVSEILRRTALAPADLALVIHGTTLATNAIIERRGAKTALITTRGFRDSVEMAYENRFEQYDINVEKPVPLVPRHLRLAVTERVTADGEILIPLAEETVHALIPVLREKQVESVAIGLIHGYARPDHEARIAEILRSELPDLWLTLASEVCPEIREYERQSTACANAYVQPLMAGYLERLAAGLADLGIAAPLLMMTSGGGLTTVAQAVREPIRLVESGPAGGAILASWIAQTLDLDKLVSFDMGGTTAKICLIDQGRPQMSRTFEVDRAYRFTKGSGLPLRIPVIEMVEIGAGGGSIARVDALRRIHVGPESAGSEPGPACYDRGGKQATVTDGDLLLGRLDPDNFAGGEMVLKLDAAAAAYANGIGEGLNMNATLSAFGVSEVVDENMANAARVHAIERGKELAGRTMVAFGGAAPLHAARVAEKLGITEIIIPTGAGVGSAIGFLRAPIAYEVVRSRYMRLSDFQRAAANDLLQTMRAEAEAVVRAGAPDGDLREKRRAYMRYVGQGHEIDVPVAIGELGPETASELQKAFETVYTRHYGRTIPGMDVEILTWSLSLAAAANLPDIAEAVLDNDDQATPDGHRPLFDTAASDFVEAASYARADLKPGNRLSGPAIITEAQTTSVIPRGFSARIDGRGYIRISRQPEQTP